MTTSTQVDLVKVYSSTIGTSGTLVLGAALASYRGHEALSDTAIYSYVIQQGSNYEYGRGVFTAAGGTLGRGVIKSSNADQPIALAYGAQVSIVLLAEDLVGLTGGATNFTIGTVTTGSPSGVSITGVWPNFVLNFVLEQGPKGDTGDSAYQGPLAAEATTRANADTSLSGQITTEANARIAADNGLVATDATLAARSDKLDTEVATIQGTLTSGRRAYTTYASAVSDAATPVLYAAVTLGQVAEIPLTDVGTHTDPVVGGTVNNSGVFRWSVAPAGWQRISDVAAVAASGYANAAAASASAAAASAALNASIPSFGRDRYRRFYDELYSPGQYTPAANDDGKFTPTIAQIGYWAVQALGDLAPGKTVSFYVRTDSGTYVSAPTLKFYDSSNAQVGSTQTATATDSDGAGRAIENVTIPALTATIRAGHQTASTSDIYEAHLCAGPTTQHLRFVNINRAALIEERALAGVRRESRGIGGNIILVNVPNGDARVYEKLLAARGGSLSTAERNAIYDAADMLKRFGLIDKLAAFYPFIGTGLGAMRTPLLDRCGYGRLVIAGSSTFVSGDWNPLNGLVTVYPTAATLIADTGIIPSDHSFGNDRYGIAIYNLADRSSSIALVCVGANDPQMTPTATPTLPVHGFFGGFAGSAIMQFGDGGVSQLNGNAAIKTGSGSGTVTTVKTAGSWVAARREDGSGFMTYNGIIANTNTGGGESTTPITLTSIPSESFKITNGTDPLGAVAIINGPMEPNDHINLHYVMHRLNQYPGVRTSPPAIEGLI